MTGPSTRDQPRLDTVWPQILIANVREIEPFERNLLLSADNVGVGEFHVKHHVDFVTRALDAIENVLRHQRNAGA